METCNPGFIADVAHSRRPTSFMSLPLELRLEIYRHALLTDQKVQAQSLMYLLSPGLGPVEIKKGFNPGILRVSRAVYEEASTIFYGENIFQYYCPAGLKPLENRSSKRNSTQIKHLEVHWQQRATKLTAECVSTMLKYHGNLGCPLKTLRLNFDLKRTYGLSAESQDALSISVMSSAFEMDRILNSIQALQVQQKIEVHLATEMEEDGPGYEYLVDAIAARLRWKAELRHHEIRQSIFDLPDQHKWSWALQPDSSISSVHVHLQERQLDVDESTDHGSREPV